MNEDKSKRQGDQLSLNTQPLQKGTQPLKPGTGMLPGVPSLKGPGNPLGNDATLRTILESTLARAGKHVQNLEQRVELLVRSIQNAGLPIPGVVNWEFKHGISPQGKKIIAYLEKVVQMKPDLARQIQVAIFRYQEAVDVVARARQSLRDGTAGAHTLEEVKLKFFYLANYHAEFKNDALLTQMFPPPDQPVGGGASGTGMLQARGTGLLSQGSDSIGRYQQIRQATLQRADALVQHLGPGMELIKRILELQKPVMGSGLLDIFNPQTKKERLMAQRLKEDARAGKHVQSALQLYGQLKEHVAEVRKGAKYEPLAEVMEYMANLLGVWHQHPVLREFFPQLDRSLFFVKRT